LLLQKSIAPGVVHRVTHGDCCIAPPRHDDDDVRGAVIAGGTRVIGRRGVLSSGDSGVRVVRPDHDVVDLADQPSLERRIDS
jgi:hypothetical protein